MRFNINFLKNAGEFNHRGRFPFDQKFRNEISGIPCDEWNSIFRLVGPSVPRFRARIRSKQRKQMMADSLPLLLALQLFHDP